MILLRIHPPAEASGAPAPIEVRSIKPVLRVGPGSDLEVAYAGPGWRTLEARLLHRGRHVEVDFLDGCEPQELLMGERVHIRGVDVELAGLLPLPDEGGEDEVTPALLSPEAAAAMFGDYEESSSATATAKTFDVEPAKTTQPSAASQPTPRPETTSQPSSHTQPSSQTQPAVARTKTTKAAANASAEHAARKQVESKGAAEATREPTARKRVRGQVILTPEERAQLAAKLRGHREFGDALVAQLRHAPFWMMSIAVHAILFLALYILLAPPKDRPISIADEEVIAEFADVDTGVQLDPLPEPEAPPASPNVTEPVEPDLAELLTTPEELEVGTERAAEDDPLLAELGDDDHDPVDIGLAPKHSSFRRRRSSSPMPDVENLERRFAGETAARSINAEAAKLVLEGALGRGARRDALPSEGELLVVDGSYDHMEKVLRVLHIPYVLKEPYEVVRSRNLSRYKIIFWNCGDPMPPVLMSKFLPRLRRWVQDGGYLFSTDWGIAQVVAPGFGEYIGTSGTSGAFSKDLVLHVEPTPAGTRHELMEGVFPRGARGQWWLERAAYDIIVRDKRRVDVLVVAPYLESTMRRDPAVAVTFKHGRGRVLHVLGHYFQEAGNLAGTIASQRLALNFVMERMGKTHAARTRGR